MTKSYPPQAGSIITWKDAPTRSVDAAGTTFVYRRLGPAAGVPVIMLNHWGATLDNFDPRIVDGLAATRPVIAVNYRGIGASGGKAPLTVAEMAKDAIAFIRALGLQQVDLLGFSLGGFVAQDIMLKEPGLVRKVVLTGTGPAGGEGIEKVGPVSWPLILKGMLTFRDPKFYLFFTSTANGRHAAKAFLKRLKEREADRDKPITMTAFLRQLKAIKAWGKQAQQNLGAIWTPVLVANGDQDRMVPTSNSIDLAHRLPNAELVLYEDAGHGGIFQYREAFVKKALEFLAR
ncbi:alpha/beta hydrolase [Sinorhizobium meliloti]|uniref:alpha/beta fold hydrolase n=1 Tax=Rhizobium meliloti TaxID=382 RepID=UPI000FD214EF|nr:alpha/beta hydrolase [Sinorhizobium meliloti]RVH11817.1 alpha/beta hydrolase [Sinorhizobium meliloti]